MRPCPQCQREMRAKYYADTYACDSCGVSWSGKELAECEKPTGPFKVEASPQNEAKAKKLEKFVNRFWSPMYEQAALEKLVYGNQQAAAAQQGALYGAGQHGDNYGRGWAQQFQAGGSATGVSDEDARGLARPSKVEPPRPVCVCGQEVVASPKLWRAFTCGDCHAALAKDLDLHDLDARIAAARPADPDPTSDWTAWATPSAEGP